jgi:hypothetical protein
MALLMPRGDTRCCNACRHQWYTAYPGLTACPKCGAKQDDITFKWPHLCARGHEALGSGECERCP